MKQPGDGGASPYIYYAQWQEVIITPDIVISYNNSTITSLSDTGTVVLDTAGKILNNDITIEYTKSAGSSKLYVFTDASYLNGQITGVEPRVSFSGPIIFEGATITFYTYGDYILASVTGDTTGTIIPFTTIQRGQYTFIMPNESVYCKLFYDD